ncbi:hypothetical protein ACNF42_07840 [Cuniculiplasma sp. SKW3]|uniref:hypothetical protein n=1 Tax=Cuniculiplasma sp. SKW3 TaxID=3400170 RepID=UPI003FD68E02
MGTQLKCNGNEIEPVCHLSHSDTFPCYEILNGNIEEGYVDLICNSSHFVRMKVDKNANGVISLDKQEDSKTIEGFIKSQKKYYLQFTDEDKELFDNFVSFMTIKHAFGSAISLRVLMENFMKKNFISPAIIMFLDDQDKGELFDKAREKNTDYLSQALNMITFTDLIYLLKDQKLPKNKKGALKNKIKTSIISYVTNTEEGKNRNLGEEELGDIKNIFDTVSNVIHGKKYDTDQIFIDSKPFFETLKKFYSGKGANEVIQNE